ncbi:MAG: glycosyltransferase, partial [Opitutae bacterium]|nr:glycosyltransferase [Opitutae bacterium]
MIIYSLKVTAIVSTFNAQHLIGGCLEDLVRQTIYAKGEMEIIVIDSGSQEEEGAIVREYQSRYDRIRYFRTEQRETLYRSWNRA